MAILRYSISLGLYLRGERLDPDSVTKILGINPTKSQKKDERNFTPTGMEYRKNIGLWALLTDSPSSNISDHFDQISSNLEKISRSSVVLGNHLLELPGVDEGYIDVFVCGVVDEEGGDCEFILTDLQVKLVGKIGLPVRFTVTTVKKD